MRGTRFDYTAFTTSVAALCRSWMFRGDSDASRVQGFSGRRRRSGGGHVERGDGAISLCAGLHVSSRRLPTGAAPGIWKPGIRRGIRGGVRGRERGCNQRSCWCGRRRGARHRQRRPYRHRQYAFGALGCQGWEAPEGRRADKRKFSALHFWPPERSAYPHEFVDAAVLG